MSIKKIAELANTSPATVSRVLNDPEHICHDPELAKRIWEIAGRLNYLPNSAARELRKGKPQLATSLTIDLFLTRFDSLDIDLDFTVDCNRESMLSIRQEVNNEILRYMDSVIKPLDRAR